MNAWETRHEMVGGIYKLLNKNASIADIDHVVSDHSFLKSDIDVASVLLLSKDGLEWTSKGVMDIHLYLIHNARLKMVKYLLPAGDSILDLGGANAPLHHMGFPHAYSKIVLIDLPTEERHKDFQVALDEEGGICEMPITCKTGTFSYDDFLIGGAITKNIDDAYIQFFNCLKL